MPISLRPIPEPDEKDCPRCWQATGGQSVRLASGTYTVQTVTGLPDFPGDRRPMTLSPGGPGAIGKCMKCPVCGYSRHYREDE